jgi:hypothetical protein
MTNGKRGFVRVDFFSQKSRMIVIRTYDPERDDQLPTYPELAAQYGNGFRNMPRCDFSYYAEIIGNQGVNLYKRLEKLLGVDDGDEFRVHQTVAGDIVIVPVKHCDICGTSIDLSVEIPTTVLTDKNVTPQDLLSIVKRQDALDSQIKQVMEENEKLRSLLKAEQQKTGALSYILMGNKNVQQPPVSNSAKVVQPETPVSKPANKKYRFTTGKVKLNRDSEESNRMVVGLGIRFSSKPKQQNDVMTAAERKKFNKLCSMLYDDFAVTGDDNFDLDI